MSLEPIRKQIEEVDWSQYRGPEYYEPEAVAPVLLSLMNLEYSSEASGVGDRILFAIGNDHADTYYPAILSALDIIIAIKQEAECSVRALCAGEILDYMSCFESGPDLG